jgi:NDP-sugar pyrophosphorylase family protein
MVIRLLQHKNKIEKELISIILCAGKGTRIANKYASIPKTLIKIKLLGDKPILEIVLDTLVKSDKINQYWVIIGYLGNKISSYISKFLSNNQELKNKVKVINAIEEYEKGPLYSLLSVLSSNLISSHQSFLIIPGDTIFENEIILETLKIIKDHKSKRPIIFYQVLDEPFQNISNSIKTVRILETSIVHENGNSYEILKKINENIKVSDLKTKKIKQILPLFALDYDFLVLLSDLAPKSEATTISEAINAIKADYQIQAYKIESNGKFFDIDFEKDLKNFNQKKSGQ